jgi:hypothetical protein
MQSDEVERLLKVWSHHYGQPRPKEWDEESSLGSGQLSGVLCEFLKSGTRITNGPAKALTAYGKASRGGQKPMPINREADQIDKLVTRIYGTDPLAALVLRGNYCLRGTRTEKAQWVASITGKRLTARRFGVELFAARTLVKLLLMPVQARRGLLSA